MEKIKLIIKTVSGKRIFKAFIIMGILSLVVYNISLISKTIFLIINKYPTSILVMALIIGLFVLFKYSDYKSNINIQKDFYRYERPYKLYSNKFNEIYFLLTNTPFKCDNNIRTFQIINNNESLDIVKAKGKIILLSNGIETHFAKCFEENFEIQDLKSNTELQILIIPTSLEVHSLIYFKVELDSLLLSDDSCYNKIELKSNFCIRNTAWILDHLDLYDYKFLFIKTKYNVKWLKERIRLLKSCIRHKCSTNVFLGLNPTEESVKAAKKDFLEKWFYRLFFWAIFLILFLLTTYSLNLKLYFICNSVSKCKFRVGRYF